MMSSSQIAVMDEAFTTRAPSSIMSIFLKCYSKENHWNFFNSAHARGLLSMVDHLFVVDKGIIPSWQFAFLDRYLFLEFLSLLCGFHVCFGIKYVSLVRWGNHQITLWKSSNLLFKVYILENGRIHSVDPKFSNGSVYALCQKPLTYVSD